LDYTGEYFAVIEMMDANPLLRMQALNAVGMLGYAVSKGRITAISVTRADGQVCGAELRATDPKNAADYIALILNGFARLEPKALTTPTKTEA
jgi:hypothetical protein